MPNKFYNDYWLPFKHHQIPFWMLLCGLFDLFIRRALFFIPVLILGAAAVYVATIYGKAERETLQDKVIRKVVNENQNLESKVIETEKKLVDTVRVKDQQAASQINNLVVNMETVPEKQLRKVITDTSILVVKMPLPKTDSIKRDSARKDTARQ